VIVKVQQSISPPGVILIYNRDRSLWHETDAPADVVEAVRRLIGDRARAFVTATLRPDGNLALRTVVRDRSW
jgi:hypothetical protein